MSWKNWPYWLRGGFIGAIIVFIFVWIGSFIGGFFIIKGFGLQDNLLDLLIDGSHWLRILKYTFIGFLLGALISYTDRKRKSKK